MAGLKYKCWLVVAVASLIIGCGQEEQKVKEPEQPASAVTLPATTAQELVDNPNLIHEILLAANPAYQGGAQVGINPQFGLVGQINVPTITDLSGLKGIPFTALDLRGLRVSDLEPLRGMPLIMLGLEGTKVKSLAPLKGAGIKKLYLNDTAVSDLEPLKGMPLEELMLVNTKVTDLSPLEGAPLKMLWLNNTPVQDIKPLASCPVLSLTLEETQVSDLSPLAGKVSLKRLHIGETKVTDLFPLKGLKLERLIFTPSSITGGLDIARGMTTLREVGVSLQTHMPPAQFWEGYDRQKAKTP